MFVYQTVFQGDHLTPALQGAEVRILKEDGFLGRKTTRVPRGHGGEGNMISGFYGNPRAQPPDVTLSGPRYKGGCGIDEEIWCKYNTCQG